jgi:hypothetical protein
MLSRLLAASDLASFRLYQRRGLATSSRRLLLVVSPVELYRRLVIACRMDVLSMGREREKESGANEAQCMSSFFHDGLTANLM